MVLKKRFPVFGLNLFGTKTGSYNEKIGKSPGVLIYQGKERKEKVRIDVLDFPF